LINRLNRVRLPLIFLLLALTVAILITVFNPPRRSIEPTPTSGTPAPNPTQSASACSPTPITFMVKADSYNISFPCAPVRTTRKANAVPFGEIEIVSEEVNIDGVDYAAAYVDYADKVPAVAFEVARGIVLDGAKRAVLRGQPVQNPTYTDLKMGDFPGVAITAEGDEKRLRARIWLVRQTTYQLIVLYPKTYTDEAAIDAFLTSFIAASGK
jgi:hypothetical protein